MYVSQIRLDEELAEKLKHIAEAKERSLNAQINYILRQYVQDYEKINGKIKEKTK